MTSDAATLDGCPEDTLVNGHADAADTLWNGTPVGWAEHYVEQHPSGERGARHAAVLAWLRGHAPGTNVDARA